MTNSPPAGPRDEDRERDSLLREVQDLRSRFALLETELATRSSPLGESGRSLLEAVIDQLPGGIGIADASTGRVILSNPRAREIFGSRERGRVAGVEDYGRFSATRADGEPLGAEDWPLARAVLHGVTITDELIHLHREDGSSAVLLVSATPVVDESGRPLVAVTHFVDITEQQRERDEQQALAQRMRLIADVTRAFAEAGRDLDTVLDTIAHQVIAVLGDTCNIRLLTADGAWLYAAAIAHRDPAAEQILREGTSQPQPADQGFSGQVLRSGEPLVLDDVDPGYVAQHTVPALRGFFEHFAVRSLLVQPVRVGKQVIGTLTVSRQEAGQPFTAGEREFVAEIANRAALAIENARLFRDAQQALAERDQSLAVLDALFASAPLGLAYLDTDLRFVRLNEALAAMNARPLEGHLGHSVRELFPRVADSIEGMLREVMDSGTPLVNVELSGYTPDAPTWLRHWLSSLYPVRAADGTMLGVGVAVTEITDRKRAEQSISMLADASRLFAEASLDADTTLATIAQHLGDTLGDACVIRLLDQEHEVMPVATIYHHDAEAQALMETLLDTQHERPDSNWVGPVVLDGRTVIFTDLDADGAREVIRPVFWPYLERYPTHSVIMSPLISRGRIIGSLRLSRDVTAYPYTNEDRVLVEDLAGRAALAIENARLFQREQEARSAAQAAETRYRSLFDGAADAIVVFDEHGNYIEANPAASRLYGYSPEEFRSMRVGSLAVRPENDPDWFERQYAEFLERGVWRGAYEVRRKDGTLVAVEGAGTRIDLPGGPVFLSTAYDISERRALERLQQDFVSMVSHELKIPLTSIRGFTQLMQRRQQYSQSNAEAILSQTDRLDRLIDDLLISARLEAGRLEIIPSLVDLVAIVRSSVFAAQQLTSRHDIRAEMDVDAIEGWWDRMRLEQVLQNLLSNAIKYAPDGGLITVRVGREGDEALVSVSDQGIGMPAVSISQLFTRFSRLESSSRANAPGLGLGLYISRSLVEAHGGRIWAESEEGIGSTFTFALPMTTPDG
jgi:PAS domain S-box-containing protein